MGKTAVIIVAGGSGLRMGSEIPKQFLPLAGRPVLVRTLESFRATLPDADIVVVLPAGEMGRWEAICREYALGGTHRVCPGGENRFQSVKAGLAMVSDAEEVLVQDGVRPLIGGALILRVLETVRRAGTAVPVVEVTDSFRRLDGQGGSAVVDRGTLRAVQTPQGFRGELLRRAYEQPWCAAFTDDASVVERAGVRITLCEGERNNIKITEPFDLTIAEAWLGKVGGCSPKAVKDK